MAITLDDLRRAGIGTNGMNPNVIPVPDLSIRGLPQNAPQQAPQPMPQQMPQQQQRRGLLGGLFGPEGRDARARLAIGLEGLTMNPNQGLIGQLQSGIEERKVEAERNRTLEWLSKLNTPEAARALQYAQATGDIFGAAKIAIASPEANRGVVVGGTVVDAVTGDIIYKGPDEAVDANIPAAFVAMDLQARAAGFVPKSEGGDGSYEEFMATRGAGFAAEATAIGTTRGEAIAGAPQEVSQADTTLGYINELRTHPGLEVGTGGSSVGNIVIGTPGYDFQSRLNQLSAGGFLTAIDQLRGMGSLSNAEGQTATRAVGRMDSATSTPEFLAALDDYENMVKLGRERAAARIVPPAGSGTTVQPTLTYNPATGAFE
jgi:hypothetical protein